MALQEFRRASGISQEELAARCGFDRSYISLIERGVQSPTVKKLVTIARVLNVRTSAIVQRMEAVEASRDASV